MERFYSLNNWSENTFFAQNNSFFDQNNNTCTVVFQREINGGIFFFKKKV